MQSATRFSSPVRAAAVETLERRQLFATIPLGELGLGHRADYATPNGTNSYTFSLTKPATLDVALSNGTASIKRNGVVMSSGEKFSRPLPTGNYSIEVDAKGGSSLLVKTSNFSPPTQLEATAWDAETIHLRWMDNTDSEVLYRVDRWTREGWKRKQYVRADRTAALIRNLVPGHATTYRVSAVDAVGDSLRSANVASAMTSTVDESGWYRINLSAAEKGEAGWNMAADRLRIHPDFRDGTNDRQSVWKYGPSWKTVAAEVITSDASPTSGVEIDRTSGPNAGTNKVHHFATYDAYDGAFDIGTGQELKDRHPTFKLIDGGRHDKLDADDKAIVIEDGYNGSGSTDTDLDFDDFYWSLDVERELLDLGIDSNSDGTITAADDIIEDDPNLPGALILVNDDDSNLNGIVDFAEPRYGQSAVSADRFTPIRISVPANVDLSIATFKFVYSDTQPNHVTKNGDGSFSNPTVFVPLPGHLSIWTADGNAVRDPRDINEGGSFIWSGFVRGSSEWAAIGITESNRTTTVYVEGIRPSDALGDLSIELSVDIDGFGSGTAVLTDRVNLSSIEVNLVSNLRKQGTRYDNLSSVVGSYKNPLVPFDLGVETLPDISLLPQAGVAVWDLRDGATTTASTAISPAVVTLSRASYGERQARVQIPVLNAVREMILNVPNLGNTTELGAAASIASENLYNLIALYPIMYAFRERAGNFGYEAGHSSDATLNSGGELDALNNSVGNALKHAFFAGRFALEFSPDEARFLTNAHEYDGMLATPQYDPTEAVMDKFNNIVGINIAKDIINASIPSEQWEAELKARLIAVRDADGLWTVQDENRIVQWNDWEDIRDTQW